MLKGLPETFERFVESEQSGAVVLMFCSMFALIVANSSFGPAYLSFWSREMLGMTNAHWVNDGLMAVFFLLIGLELERELYVGELSNIQKVLLPLFAALGGMLAPALIHYGFNIGTATQKGFGIPMATDIAFALGILAILGKQVPTALKVFVVAFAVMDDLGAIAVIALFYTDAISIAYLAAALALWSALLILNLHFRVMAMMPYLLGGVLLWFLMLKSGVHSTIAGVLLAFAIPFRAVNGVSPSHQLEHVLHRPTAFIILPIFALANAGILFGADWMSNLTGANSVGIVAGLLLGKPTGILLFCWIATLLGICRLPTGLNWSHLLGAGLLGGVGFTMSIFITNLAFEPDTQLINASKTAVMLASVAAGILGFTWLRVRLSMNVSPG